MGWDGTGGLAGSRNEQEKILHRGYQPSWGNSPWHITCPSTDSLLRPDEGDEMTPLDSQ